MYSLLSLLKFTVAFLYRWAMDEPDTHPYGCHCEKCMAEYSEELKRRRG